MFVNKRGLVTESFSCTYCPGGAGNGDVCIGAEHAGRNGYIKYLKAGNSKKYERSLGAAIGPNGVWDSSDAEYLAYALDELPGLADSFTSIAVSIDGSSYFFALFCSR